MSSIVSNLQWRHINKCYPDPRRRPTRWTRPPARPASRCSQGAWWCRRSSARAAAWRRRANSRTARRRRSPSWSWRRWSRTWPAQASFPDQPCKNIFAVVYLVLHRYIYLGIYLVSTSECFSSHLCYQLCSLLRTKSPATSLLPQRRCHPSCLDLLRQGSDCGH